MAKDKNMNQTVDTSEKLLEFETNKVLVDHAFNTRHSKHMSEQPTEEPKIGSDGKPIEVKGPIPSKKTSVTDLSFSIEEDGQDTPVWVRPNPDKTTNKEKPYVLVSGFRRFSAILLIAERAVAANVRNPIKKNWPTFDAKNPTIQALVKNMSSADAFLANMRENTARDDLSGADLAFGVHRLLQEYKSEKGTTRGGKGEIARSLKMDPGYIGQLADIMATLDPKITNHWRSVQKPLPVNTMSELLDTDKIRPEERQERYDAWCAAGGQTSKKGETDPLEAMCKSLNSAGIQLGRLHALGYIKADNAEWGILDFQKEIATIKKKHLDSGAKQMQLAKAGRDGFAEGIAQVAKEAQKRLEKAKKGETETEEDDDAETAAAAN